MTLISGAGRTSTPTPFRSGTPTPPATGGEPSPASGKGLWGNRSWTPDLGAYIYAMNPHESRKESVYGLARIVWICTILHSPAPFGPGLEVIEWRTGAWLSDALIRAL